MMESTEGTDELSVDSLIAGVQGLSGFTEALATSQQEREGTGVEPEPDVVLPVEAAPALEETSPAEVSPAESDPETTASAESVSEPEEASFTEPEPVPESVLDEESDPSTSDSQVTTPIYDELFNKYGKPGEDTVTDLPDSLDQTTADDGIVTAEEEVLAPAEPPAQPEPSPVEPAWPDPDGYDPDCRDSPKVSEEQAPSGGEAAPSVVISQEQPAPAETIVPPRVSFSGFSPRRRLRAWRQLNVSRVVRFVILMLVLDYYDRTRRAS